MLQVAQEQDATCGVLQKAPFKFRQGVSAGMPAGVAGRDFGKEALQDLLAPGRNEAHASIRQSVIDGIVDWVEVYTCLQTL